MCGFADAFLEKLRTSALSLLVLILAGGFFRLMPRDQGQFPGACPYASILGRFHHGILVAAGTCQGGEGLVGAPFLVKNFLQ